MNSDHSPKQAWSRYIKSIEAYYAIKWRKRWLKSDKGRVIAGYRPYPSIQALKLYQGRTKAFSSALIQLRTEKIGLNAFLYGMKVPDIVSPQCECQQGEETVQHFLFNCSRWSEFRSILGDFKDKTLKYTLGSREGSRKAVEFLLATKRLEQFQHTAL